MANMTGLSSHALHRLKPDPAHEPTHRHLMQLYATLGQPTAALRQFTLCGEALRAELGIAPSAKTIVLKEEILGGRF